MRDFLRTIVQVKRAEISVLKKKRGSLSGRSEQRRPFYDSITGANVDKKNIPAPLALIAEIKKASPSRGGIRPELDVVSQAQAYESAGAQAVSVLTEERYFKGSLNDLSAVRAAIGLPVLRKDFIIDPLQILESAGINADAVLLIAAMLSHGQLDELYHAAQESGLDPLVEIHSLRELKDVLKLPLKVLGINNRNLSTLAVDTKTVPTIMPHVPAHIAVIAESGIATGADARALRSLGVRGLLVGEALVRAEDINKLIKELRCADSY